MEWAEVDNSPVAIRRFLVERDLAPKKRWGQNFMVSPGSRQMMIDAAEMRASDEVWEIGPGLGAITQLAVAKAGSATVFEIDHGIIRIINERFGDAVRVVPGDAVRTIPVQMRSGHPPPDIVFGNLPYRSAAAIVGVIIETGVPCRRLVITVQREMAARMCSLPGQKDYSPFSVLCQLGGQVALIGDLAPGGFYPVPEVVSTLVAIDFAGGGRNELVAAGLCARSLFASRRKTIRNNAAGLASAFSVSRSLAIGVIEEAGIELSARAETLAPEAFLKLGSLILNASATPDESR